MLGRSLTVAASRRACKRAVLEHGSRNTIRKPGRGDFPVIGSSRGEGGKFMFSNHGLLRVAGVWLGAAGFLLASMTVVQAQSPRERSAASYFARGSDWQAHGELDRAIADFGIAITFNPRFARAYYFRARAHLSK